MGVLKWVNRLLFGAESVAKSGAGKVKDAGSDAYENLKDTADDLFVKGKEKASEISEDLQEKLDDIGDKLEDKLEDAKDFAEDVGDRIKRKTDAFRPADKGPIPDGDMPDNVEDLVGKELGDEAIQSKPKHTIDEVQEAGGGETLEKLAGFTETVGDKVLETGKKVGEKMKEIGEKKLEIAKDMAEKAERKMTETMDDIMGKAEEMAREEAEEEAANPTGIREDSTHADALKGSLLDETDDFFSKAAAFADGKYEKVRDDIEIISTKPKKSDKGGSVKGFEDMDGDGDPIIDDAILAGEEE